jgi:ABC-type glycerol-3-phosphate transport system substrate-binding protein
MQALTRRTLVTALAPAAAVLAGCGAGAPPEAPETRAVQKVAIDWWTGWGGVPANESFKRVEEAANAQARSYEVKHLRVTGVADKLAEAIVAGSPPAVEAGNLPYAEFWVKGFAEPLEQRITKSKVVKRDELPASAWKFAGYKGKTFGVPAVEGFIRWGLAANEDLLAKRGLDPKNLPATWEDLLAWHRELTVVEGGAIRQLGLDPMNAMGGGTGGPDPLLWGPSWGHRFYDEAKEEFHLAHPAMEEALTTIKRFYDVSGGPTIVEFRTANPAWSGTTSGITVGTEAMQINGPWTPGELAKNAPDKRYAYSWVPVPAGRKGKKVQSTGGHFGLLPKGSPNPDQGFEFLEYLWSDQALDIIFEGTGWLTARKSYLSRVDAARYRGLDFYIRSVSEANEMYEAPVNPIDGFFGPKWRDAVADVRDGKVNAKTALQELQRLCTEELRQRLGKS